MVEKEILSIVEPVKDSGVGVKEVKHDGWDQFSIIVSIPGENSEKVVIGSHQDSINLLFPSLLKAPGADDNGSGTVTCLESLRLIAGGLVNGFKPKIPLSFISILQKKVVCLGRLTFSMNTLKTRKSLSECFNKI